MTYAIHEFSKWPFAMTIESNGETLLEVSRHSFSTNDTIATVSKRPENIAQYAALMQLVERANRAEAAEARAAEIEADRDKWKEIAETDHWPFEWEIATQLKSERDTLRAKLAAEEAAHKTDVTALRAKLGQAHGYIKNIASRYHDPYTLSAPIIDDAKRFIKEVNEAQS